MPNPEQHQWYGDSWYEPRRHPLGDLHEGLVTSLKELFPTSWTTSTTTDQISSQDLQSGKFSDEYLLRKGAKFWFTNATATEEAR